MKGNVIVIVLMWHEMSIRNLHLGGITYGNYCVDDLGR